MMSASVAFRRDKTPLHAGVAETATGVEVEFEAGEVTAGNGTLGVVVGWTRAAEFTASAGGALTFVGEGEKAAIEPNKIEVAAVRANETQTRRGFGCGLLPFFTNQ